jgi:hypothetical protein
LWKASTLAPSFDMNHLPHLIAALLLAAGVCVATAAAQIPSSVLPGRERDRFTESPVERFMQPGPYQAPPVIEPATQPGCTVHKARHARPRSARARNC